MRDPNSASTVELVSSGGASCHEKKSGGYFNSVLKTSDFGGPYGRHFLQRWHFSQPSSRCLHKSRNGAGAESGREPRHDFGTHSHPLTNSSNRTLTHHHILYPLRFLPQISCCAAQRGNGRAQHLYIPVLHVLLTLLPPYSFTHL